MALTTIRNDGLAIGSQGFTESSKITLSAATESVTGIPDGVREVHCLWDSLSTSSGTPGLNLRVGPSSGILTTGYTCQYGYLYDSGSVGRGTSTGGFEIGNWGASASMHGFWSLYRTNGTDDVWVVHYFTTVFTAYAGQIWGTGLINLSGNLDRVALVCANAGTFDAGTMQVLYR